MPRDPRRILILCALPLLMQACGGEPPRIPLPVATLRVRGREIRAEVARAPREMSRGLMYRRTLGKDSGMLFSYASPRPLSFWMKNTRIPLDIAFLDGEGRILQIEQMRQHRSVHMAGRQCLGQHATGNVQALQQLLIVVQ